MQPPIFRPIGLLFLLTAAALAAPASGFPPEVPAGRSFEFEVRELFFRGLRGDQAALDRAMRLCEDALAVDAGDAEALVWHGSGLVFRAGQAYEAGDLTAGGLLLERGLDEMDRAVGLEPDTLATRIPRATTLIALADNTPLPGLARDYRRKAVGDLEKVWQLQRPYFEHVSVHGRGELMAGLADAYLKMGDSERALEILTRMAQELPGSSYAEEARRFLSAPRDELPAAVRTCHGCHDGGDGS
ncbi:MAG: hypothetical protein R3325_10505 [Thermoanaerobaculia bacterium]|nr:hypothetical protein [Thermoanaerobaculia bacterium]